MTHAGAPDPDATLARFRARRDPKDLAALFDATAPDLHRVAVATAPDAAAAEDALQETFLAVIAAVERWDPARRAMPWLLGILRFKVARQRERARRLAPTPASDVGDARGASPDAVGDAEEARRAWAEIERLDEPYRGVALLRWRYGLSPAEIAHVRGELPTTTRSILSRALDRVRRGLRALPAVFGLGEPERGLGAVRQAVLAAARPPRTALPVRVSLVAGAAAALFVATTMIVVERGRDGPRARPETTLDPLRATTASTTDGRPLAAPASGPRATTASVRGRARGRVVDTDGRPVVGATVASARDDAVAFVTVRGPVDARAAGAIGTTDRDGRFDVAADGEGPVIVFVLADGKAPTVVGPAQPGTELAATLLDGETWAGHVHDERGAPVGGAAVRAHVAMPWFAFERATTTDADGAWRLPAMPGPRALRPGLMPPSAWVQARVDGRPPATLDVPLAPGGRRDALELVLRPGVRVVGQVIDGDGGAPVERARVRVVSHEMGSGWLVETFELRPVQSPFANAVLAEAATDDDGRFTIEAVPGPDGRSWHVEVTADDRAPTVGRPPPPDAVGTAHMTLTVWRSTTVRGRVVARDGTPLAVATGTVGWEDDPSRVWSWRTDTRGRFELGDVAVRAGGSDLVVRVLFPGRGESRARARSGVVCLLDDLVVDPPTSASVTVMPVRAEDEAGRAVAGALVRPVGGHGRAARTDRDGGATLSCFPQDADAEGRIAVAATAPGFARTIAWRGPTEPADRVLVLRLPPGRDLEGIVRRRDGSPAPGAFVWARRAADAPDAGPSPGSPDVPLAVADARGSFELFDLDVGPWTLSASATAPDGTRSPPTTTSPPVEAGRGPVVLVLPGEEAEAATPRASVAVRVVDDATGATVRRAVVRLRRGDRESHWAKDDGSGVYVASDVPEGTWTLRIAADGYPLRLVSDVVVARGRADPIEVRLRRGVSVVLHARDLPGDVDASERVLRLSRVEEGAGAQVPLDEDGRGETQALEVGRYRAVLGSLGALFGGDEASPVRAWAAAEGVITVAPGATTLDLRLVPAGSITVTVDDPRLADPREPAPGAPQPRPAGRLVLLDSRGETVAATTSVRAGTLGGLVGIVVPPGRYRARWTPPDGTTSERDVDVAAGRRETVTLSKP